LRIGIDHDEIALAVMFARDLHDLRSGRGHFGKFVAEDAQRWAKVIRAANIKPD
jgi:hypothetical protein